MPQEQTTITEWIAALASAELRERERAARELFRVGAAAAEPVLKQWFADAQFRELARTGSSLLTVGIAVQPENFELIRSRFGRPQLADVPADQDALEFEIEFGHGVRLDILTSRDASGTGAIARFLQRFGQGIQQVECDVRDVTKATELLRTRFSLQPIYPETRRGANNTRVNFFLVAASDGQKVLMELVEVPASKKHKR